MSEFKPGDRVKVEYETTILGKQAVLGDGWYRVRHPFHRSSADVAAHVGTMTKLPDPEPQWRKGDVVRFRDHKDGPVHVALRTGGLWQCSCGADFRDEEHAYRWTAGFVEVLHREDPS